MIDPLSVISGLYRECLLLNLFTGESHKMYLAFYRGIDKILKLPKEHYDSMKYSPYFS